MVALAAAFAAPIAAQDVFSLPPGTASPTARPAGPVDSDSPIIRSRPAQPATAQPATTPAPNQQASATPGPARSRPAARPAPGAMPRVAASPTAPATASSLPAPVISTALPTASPATVSTAAPAATDTPARDAPGSSDWAAFATGALVGALALLALVGGLIWRRRQPGAAPVDFEPPVVPAAAPKAKPDPSPEPTVAPAEPDPVPAPAPEAQPEGLQIALEARRIDASLMATTLVYAVRLTNHGQAPLGALAVGLDMVAAHSSLPVEQQIANPADRLELRHQLAGLAPGESAELKGEVRLPLAAITPIRAGNAAYFVPLARLRVEAAQAGNEPLVVARTFVVGEQPEQAGAALRPLRLDLGPRTFGKLGQRAVG